MEDYFTAKNDILPKSKYLEYGPNRSYYDIIINQILSDY